MVFKLLSVLWLLISTICSYFIFINNQKELTVLGVSVAFLATFLMIYILYEANQETSGDEQNIEHQI